MTGSEPNPEIDREQLASEFARDLESIKQLHEAALRGEGAFYRYSWTFGAALQIQNKLQEL